MMANIVRIAADGSVECLTANIETRHEVERLGLVDVKTVCVRQVPAQPDPTFPRAASAPPIPEELRGRVGTVVRVGSLYKYDVTAQVRLHRARPGEARETLTLPLLWLEKHEG